ncbi:MAG: hypothetical protein ACKVHL_08265, partial [Rhodospirillales bacterium]
PNGVVAIGNQLTPMSKADVEKNLGYALDDTRFDTAQDLLEPFGENVDRVYFSHDVHPTMRERNGDLMVIFQLPGE